MQLVAYADAVPPSRRRSAASPAKSAPERQVNFRLPVAVCLRLEAAAAVLGNSQARIIADAVTTYLDALPSVKRRVIDDVLAVRQKP